MEAEKIPEWQAMIEADSLIIHGEQLQKATSLEAHKPPSQQGKILQY